MAALALEGPALLRSHPGLDASDAGVGDADTGTASAFLVPPLALAGDEGVGRFDSGTAWRMSLSRRACASVVALAVLSLFRGTATRAVLTGTELFRPLRFRKAQAAKVGGSLDAKQYLLLGAPCLSFCAPVRPDAPFPVVCVVAFLGGGAVGLLWAPRCRGRRQR